MAEEAQEVLLVEDGFSQSVRMIGQYWLQFNQTPKP